MAKSWWKTFDRTCCWSRILLGIMHRCIQGITKILGDIKWLAIVQSWALNDVQTPQNPNVHKDSPALFFFVHVVFKVFDLLGFISIPFPCSPSTTIAMQACIQRSWEQRLKQITGPFMRISGHESIPTNGTVWDRCMQNISVSSYKDLPEFNLLPLPW